MFVPTKIRNVEYVDGGLVSPVPVQVARDLGADVVIAVDILAQPIHTETSNVWGLFNQNINIMQGRLAEEELKNADIVIQPDLREKAHIFDIKGREMTMQAGIDAAKEKLANIQWVIKSKTKQVDLNQQDLALKMSSLEP
jgi:NTE family protein